MIVQETQTFVCLPSGEEPRSISNLEACGCCGGDSENDETSPQAKLSAPSYFYKLGFTLGTIGAASAVLLVWIGVWVQLEDNYFLPGHPRTYSALTSVGVATLLAIMTRSHASPAAQYSRSTIHPDTCHGVWHLLLEGYVSVLETVGTSSSPVLKSALGCDCCSCHGDFDYHCIGSICCAYCGAADRPRSSQNRLVLETIPETLCWLQSPTRQSYYQKWRTRTIPAECTATRPA